MNTQVMFSSKSDDWATPQDFFDKLNEEFHFTLDVCATPENAKCARYFTKEQDGLTQSWAGEVCWMNPQYQEPERPCKKKCLKKRCKERGWHTDVYIPGCIDWMCKAYDAAFNDGSTVVCLVPSRTDNEWWHSYVEPIRLGFDSYVSGEIRFVKGRLSFGDGSNSAPFPSAVVVMRPRPR